MPGYIKSDHKIPTYNTIKKLAYTTQAYTNKICIQYEVLKSGCFNPTHKKIIKHVNNVVPKLIYYARSVDPTLAAVLIATVSREEKGKK